MERAFIGTGLLRRRYLSTLFSTLAAPLVGSSVSAADSDRRHLFINGATGNRRGAFEIEVTEAIEPGWSGTTGESVGRGRATGVVWGTWEVDYFFTGEITSFETDGDMHIYVVEDGSLPDKLPWSTAVDPPGRHLLMRGRDTRTDYELRTSGPLESGWSTEGTETIDEQVARGVLWGDKWDDYFFVGDLTDIKLNGTAELFIDGHRVDLATVGSPDGDLASQYVSTSGDEFRLDDRPYTAAGTNSFWSKYTYWDRSAIDETIAEAVTMGLNTLRVWGFGSGNPQLFQPTAREYNEAAFERFDYLIEQARANGIKLIVALGNYWPDFGGIDQYVEWSDDAEKRSDFYEDETCQSIYRDYLKYVLTRENTLTGTEYRDDPTIMLWELLNEARHPAAPDGNGEVLHRWAHDTARFVKSLDDAHLVSTGVEGFVLGATTEYDDVGYWMNTQGYDFVGIHDSPYIDAASIHLYPDSWQISNAAAIQFIRDRSHEAATELGKPIYVGEFGKAVDWHATNVDQQISVRNDRYEQWYNAMANGDVDGALFWQLVPDAYSDNGDEFTVSYPRDRSTAETIQAGVDMLDE